MAKGTKGASAPQGGRRPRAAVWALTGLVIAALALGLVLLIGGGDGDDSSAGARTFKSPNCGGKSPRSFLCPDNELFDAKAYVTRGDAFACIEFATQADTQAVLKADPSDPNKLDADRDGIACNELGGSRDTTPVKAIVANFKCGRSDPRTARCPQRSRPFDPARYVASGQDGYDCGEFASQADAQQVLQYSPQDPNKLDGDGDGIACPDRPGPKNLTPVGRAPQT